MRASERPAEPWVTRPDVRFALIVIAVLAVAGVVAGLIWSAWARTATRGYVYSKTAIIPDQTEGFIGSDGRFIVITAVIGLVAGVVVWRRRDRRGPIAIAALGVGAVIGALLTDLTGRLVGGGTDHGTVNTVVTRLPLQVHAIGGLFIEALLALALYWVCALLINPDDLGRSRGSADGPDEARSTGLVGAGLDVQHGGRDGNAAGPGQ